MKLVGVKLFFWGGGELSVMGQTCHVGANLLWWGESVIGGTSGYPTKCSFCSLPSVLLVHYSYLCHPSPATENKILRDILPCHSVPWRKCFKNVTGFLETDLCKHRNSCFAVNSFCRMVWIPVYFSLADLVLESVFINMLMHGMELFLDENVGSYIHLKKRHQAVSKSKGKTLCMRRPHGPHPKAPVNPFPTKISLVILFTICNTVLVLLVWRIWYWISQRSLDWHFSLYSSLVCWYFIDVKRRNFVLVIRGSSLHLAQ